MYQAKINVLIVTYKQADVIGRNIESILNQKEYGLNEIVICDDCSPDNNWEIISEYAKKYPGIIRAYQNNPNLGIYGNSNKLASLCGDADLYCWLEGDDALCDVFFKSIQEFIQKKNIDLSEALGIFGDYKAINVNGDENIIKNDFANKGYNPYGAYLRNIATWRASVFTSSVIRKFEPVDTTKGLILSETLFDSQWFKFIDKAYYNPVVGSIYYTGIGVSATWGLSKTDSDYRTTGTIEMWEYLINNHLISEKDDIYWAKSKIAQSRCIQEFSLSNLWRFVKYQMKGLSKYHINYWMLFLQFGHLCVLGLHRKD